MNDRDEYTVASVVLSEDLELTLGELCRSCGVNADYVIALVEEGLLEPSRVERGRWRFTGTALVRARTALRLQRDLDLNTPGVAMAMELLDEVRMLRARVEALERLLG